jgi:hypothetical protein
MTKWMGGTSRSATAGRMIRLGMVVLIGMLGLLLGVLKARAARASTSGTVIQTARADVDDGDGLDDVVTIVRTASSHYFLHVRLADGRRLSAPIAQAPGAVQLLKVGNVNRSPGDELFVGGNIEGNQQVQVFTYRRGRLSWARPMLEVGTPGIGIDWGVSCTTSNGQYFITQHNYHETNIDNGRWTESDVKYEWQHRALHRYSTRSRHRINRRPTNLFQLSCGHKPVR